MLKTVNGFYKRSDNRTLNGTSNIYDNINQYATDVVHGYKNNKVLNLKICIVILLMMSLLINITPYTLLVKSMY